MSDFSALTPHMSDFSEVSPLELNGRKTWLPGHLPAGTPVLTSIQHPVFINLDNVLTIERQNDLTMVTMVGGEQVYIDTMPETLIGTVARPGPV
jgi:hypothetical protein